MGALANGINGDEKATKIKKFFEVDLKLVIVLGNPFLNDLEIQEKLTKANLLVHIGTTNSIWSKRADIVLPGQYYSEKVGTYTNKNQIVQSTEIAVQALRRTRPEWQILSELSNALGEENSFKTVPEVFDTMAEEVKAFSGLRFEDIKEVGMKLKNKINDSGMRLVKAH